jgi:hypothetical protein
MVACATAALFTGLLRGEIMSIVGNSSSIFDKIGFSIVTFSLLSFSTVSTYIKSSKIGTKKSIKGKTNEKRERLSTGESEKERKEKKSKQ